MRQIREGQVRIPSGCAIAAVISREGRRMTAESIIEAMKPMHDRSNGLGGGFAGYGIYPEHRDLYAFHFFFDSRATRKDCEAFLKERFEVVKGEMIPTRKMPAITDEPIIWRYFVTPLRSVLADLQLDEREFVVRTAMKINAERTGVYCFSCGKNMGAFNRSDFRKTSARITVWMNTKAIAGRRMGAIRPTPPVGGAVRIRLHCWIIPLYTTVRSRPMTPIAGLWKCSGINAPCKPIRKSSPIYWIIYCAYKS